MQTLSNNFEAVGTDNRTISDLQKNGYGELDREIVKDILYLEQLSASTSQPIKLWPVIEMLKAVDRGNKRAINKLFFNHIEVEKKEAIGALDSETFSKIQTSIFNQTQRRRETLLIEARRSYTNSTSAVREMTRDLNKYILKAREAYDRIDDLENLTPAKTMEAFQRILAMPFWKFENFSRDKLYIATANEVVMTERNKAAGLDIQVNFGRIRFKLNIARGELTALPCENNFLVKSYFHPFISTAGGVCFGTHADQAYNFLIHYEYDKVFELLASLLCHYDGSSGPYQRLVTFWDAEKKGLGTRINPKQSLCPNCGEYPNEEEYCECKYCDFCDATNGHDRYECEHQCRDCDGDSRSCGCSDEEEELDEDSEGNPF